MACLPSLPRLSKPHVLNDRFDYITTALEYLPDGTVVGGEVVALAPNGRADFLFRRSFALRSLGASTTC